MSAGWEHDKRWSDKFLPEIKSALGRLFIGAAPVEEDQERNTDLIVLKLEAVRVACRIRKHKYLAGYGRDFTIRAGRPTGTKTELTKIIEGWGQYLFYGFADEDEEGLAAWRVADLSALRIGLNRRLYAEGPAWQDSRTRKNVDGSSTFLAIPWDEFDGVLYASGGIWPGVAVGV